MEENTNKIELAEVPAVAKPKLWVITESEFADLEAKYKHLYIVDVAFDVNERYQFIARRPSKSVIEAMTASKTEPFKILDIMVKNMIVAGDKEALDDGVVYSRVVESLSAIAQEGKKLFTKA